MSKEWWICQKYQYGGSGHAEKCFYASKSKESVLDHSGGNLIGKPIHVVEYQALADKDLTIRKQAVEIEELRKQRHELLISGNIRDDEMGLIQRYDLEIEAKKAEVK